MEFVITHENDFDNEIGDFYDNADTERGRQLFHLLSGREREKPHLIDDTDRNGAAVADRLLEIGVRADDGREVVPRTQDSRARRGFHRMTARLRETTSTSPL